MSATVEIVAGLGALAERGISVAPSPSGTLQVRPASHLTPDEREWLRVHAGAILERLKGAVAVAEPTLLSGGEPWDGRVAVKLMCDADALVDRLGVDGRHPAVANAAARVTSAHATRDLETLRFAVAEFVVLVRTVAAERAAKKVRVGEQMC